MEQDTKECEPVEELKYCVELQTPSMLPQMSPQMVSQMSDSIFKAHESISERIFKDSNRFEITFYYIIRIFSVLIVIFLAIIAYLYSMGQLVKLQRIEIYCPSYNQKEVLTHNALVGDATGI